MRHDRFEWDSKKAVSNFKKHRVRFETAAEVLADPFAWRLHVTESDVEHSTGFEERFWTMGSHSRQRTAVMKIVWTRRADESGDDVTRIISARLLSKRELQNYEEQIAENEMGENEGGPDPSDFA